mmetsp:Transcript_28134/g.36866  ORF Transcript_28134/g.36866 Transcript_28134/m.36866 type:complete len:180 (+) Transcript_28134:80-619(+)
MMAEEEDTTSSLNGSGVKVTSTLPVPPKYYEEFKENIVFPDPPSIPEGIYHMFGNPYTSQAEPASVLQEGGRLYPENISNYKGEMKRLLNSVICNFTNLLDILVSCPSKQSSKIEDIEKIFVNFHNLLNEYRPHQARHMVMLRLQRQNEEEKKAIETLQRQIEQSAQLVENAKQQFSNH